MTVRYEKGPDQVPASTELRPVVWMRPVDDPQRAVRTMEYLSQVVADSGEMASISLVVRSQPGCGISAWLGVHALDAGSVPRMRRLMDSAVDFLGCGEPVGAIDSPDGDRGMVFRFEAADDCERVVSRSSMLWRYLAAAQHPWQLTISVSEHGSGSGGEADIGISLIGAGDDVSMAPALLQADVLGGHRDRRLVPVHVGAGEELEALRAAAAQGKAPLAGVVPRSMAAQFLGLVARAEGAWPVVPEKPLEVDAVLDAIDAAQLPHVLIQGGSGLGKTTLLENLIRRDVDDGTPLLVVCPHGDLAQRAAAQLLAGGARARIVDFGAEEPVLWNLTHPDPGVSPEEHASLLVAVLRELWTIDGDEYFGPVWTRITRTLLTILAADPAGPWPLTRFPELLDVRSRFRDEALDRLDDEKLARAVVRELLPMLDTRDPGNTAAWIAAKLDPLIGDPTFRAIIDTPVAAFPIEGLLEGESLVVAVPEGRLTAKAAQLLAGMTIGRVWRMVKRRRSSQPIHVYLDEWQRMAVPAIGELLAEGRKFGLKVRLANQNSAQVPRRLWETATANVGITVSFRVGPYDAVRNELLYPRLSPAHLTRLPDHWVAFTGGVTDAVAPTPKPLRRDGGRALEAGHAASVEETKAALRSEIAGRIGALVGKRQEPRSLPSGGRRNEMAERWMELRRR